MNQISLNPSAIARMLGLVICLLVIASIMGQVSTFVFGHSTVKGLVPLFNLNSERNIPTFFSMLLLLLASLLLTFITLLNWKQRNPHVSKWAILSIGFFFMAYDEAFQVHEKLGNPVHALLGNNTLGGFFFYSWVIPGLAIVCLLGIIFIRFLLHLPAKTRIRFLIAGTMYIGGAIGFEMIGGRYLVLQGGNQTLTYSTISTLEESLEMAGLVVFIWGLLIYCADTFEELRFRFES
ncbi:multidrug transporter [Desulfocastanea catecholica]